MAEGADLASAYRKALACDSTSAYGGIIAFNRTLDADAANAVAGIFTEVIIAPDATDEAIAIIGKRKNLRLLLAGGPARSARGGTDGENRGRRPAGAVARQCGGRRYVFQDCHQGARPPTPNCVISDSRSASPST